MDSNGDGVGDLPCGGKDAAVFLQIIGSDVIWLSPVYRSPNDDNDFDISDYRDIMTEFGTLEISMRVAPRHTNSALRSSWIWSSTTVPMSTGGFVGRKIRITRTVIIISGAGKDGKNRITGVSCFDGSHGSMIQTTDMYYLPCFPKKQPDLQLGKSKTPDRKSMT